MRHLPALRSDSALTYLAAIGTISLLAQTDPEARAGWHTEGGLAVWTTADLIDAIAQAQPPVLLSPWNNASGFARQGLGSRVIEAALSSRDARLREHSDAICIARDVVQRAPTDTSRKSWMIAELRACWPDLAVRGLDATLAERADGRIGYSPLMGSGGNEGKLEYGVTHLRCLIDLYSDDERSGRLIRALLDGHGMQQSDLQETYSFGALAGGVEFRNPWLYALAIAGVMAFGSSVLRRYSRAAHAFPHTFYPAPVGYGSGSRAEATRGALWLPVWNGAATWRSIEHLIRQTRYLRERRWKSGVFVYEDVATEYDAIAALLQGLVTIPLHRHSEAAR